MASSANRSLHRRIAIAAAVVVPLLAVVLYSNPPREGSFYPRCLFHWFTGLHCPGCGTTRCLYALLHGELRQALAYNVLAAAVLPFLAVYVGRRWWAALRGRTVQGWRQPAWLGWVLVGVFLAYWILRNLPLPPFAWLAPHLVE